MNYDVLNMICCPECQNSFNLSVDSEENGEIREGQLICSKCNKNYKIKEYIPRFVESDKYVSTFSFEWTLHQTTQLDSDFSTESEDTFKIKTGFEKEEIKDKLVLDVGCGAGRFMDVIEKWGGIVIGIDLSFAVDAAFKNLGLRENVHILQADLFNLPFAEGTFDIVFSIGVLHHTPNCEDAFYQLPRLLKSGGKIAIWVYGYFDSRYIATTDRWRRITTKLPKRLLYAISHVAIPLYYVYKLRFIGSFLNSWILPIDMHPYWRWRVLNTFDWYSPKYQSKHTYPEVYRWFKDSGLTNIELLDRQVSVKGERP